MANDFSAILPELHRGVDMVARELTGFIPACRVNSDASAAGLNQTVNYPITQAATLADITPAAQDSAGTDLAPTNGTIVMDKFRKASFHMTGEQSQALMNGDRAQKDLVLRDTITQAVRALTNEIETALAAAAYKGASRAYGTAGTTPFGTAGNLTDFANIKAILEANGAPMTDLSLIASSAAMINLRGVQSVLFKVNEAGSSQTLRQGAIGDVFGLAVGQSPGLTTHTKGTGTSYQLSAAGAIGDETISVDTGSGTLLAGDIVTFAGTTTKYVANSALAGGSFSIGQPGLLVPEADNDAITIGNNYTPNVAFHRDALHLVMRRVNAENDKAAFRTTLADPQTGLIFDLARYDQYMQGSWEVQCIYGVKAANSKFIATLLG